MCAYYVLCSIVQQQGVGAALCERHPAADQRRRGLGAGVLGDELDAQGGAHLGGAGQVSAVFASVFLEHSRYD